MIQRPPAREQPVDARRELGQVRGNDVDEPRCHDGIERFRCEGRAQCVGEHQVKAPIDGLRRDQLRRMA